MDLTAIRKEKEFKNSRYEIDPKTGKVIERIKVHAKVKPGTGFDINNLEDENKIDEL